MENKLSYLGELNQQQRDAVTYIDGPQLVIAGAGSGKTRVLTYKILHLLTTGIQPYNILALTFTNKAAREMKDRVAATVGIQQASRLWMGTFHSVFLRILRQNSDKIGFRRDFTIYDAADAKALVKSIIKTLELEEKDYKPSTITAIISNSKNTLINADSYAHDVDIVKRDKLARRPETAKIFKIYEQRCRAANAMDFDDILYYMNVLLRDNPDITAQYSSFFRYILVDEYQDTNFAQHLIISSLAKEHGNICVVGDDAQSIYSFRGANISNILSLQKTFPTLRTFKLERNYRSTQNIINAASSLISKNTQQIPKNVYSENEVGEKVQIIRTDSDIQEASTVAAMVSRFRHTHHDSLENYVVLYRTNAQSRTLEEAFRTRNIPYRIYGGVAFYQRKEIKDAICYFRLCVNPDDDEALQRVINYPPRGIGETTMKKIRTAALDSEVSMSTVIADPISFGVNVNNGTMSKLRNFTTMMEDFTTQYRSGASAFDSAQEIYNRTGIMRILEHDNTPESISRQENLKELLVALKDFTDARIESEGESPTLDAFLSEIALATDQDSDDDDSTEKITFMTVHAAKGLEFNNVFIVGVEEDLFPSTLSADTPAGIEEERRLLYVAITRACKRCILTYTGSRFRNGATVFPRRSRFIDDIEPEFLRMPAESEFSYVTARKPFVDPISNWRHSEYELKSNNYICKNYSTTFTSSVSPRKGISTTASAASFVLTGTESLHTPNEISTGTRIRHPRFGEGIITDIEHSGPETVIHVNFNTMGCRKLLLKFAKFDIIK